MTIKNRTLPFFIFLFSFFIACATTPAETQPAMPSAAVYRIGDSGPAGGIIFYDKGNNSDGWRYLEAAPAETERRLVFSREDLGNDTIHDAAIRTVGSGKRATRAIVDYFIEKRGGGFNTAARYCDDLVVGKFDDWYLPSLDELNHMYGNLHLKKLGVFRPDLYYCSTLGGKGNTHNIIRLSFEDGRLHEWWYVDQLYLVRACRQF